MMPSFDLMLITDEGPGLVPRLTLALACAPPGRVAVQLRRKDLPARELYELGRHVQDVTAARGAWLVVNDRVDVALALGAQGVHLPERGLSVVQARQLVGSALLIGRSCHDGQGLEEAAELGADYALLAPVHAVPGKAPALGVEGFRKLCVPARLPVYALGGIDSTRAAALKRAGARGVAVMRYVLDAEDPAGRLASLLDELEHV